VSNVKAVPKGCERAIPHLIIDGAAKAIDFYKDAFGAEEIWRSQAPGGEKIMHAEIRIGDSVIYLCRRLRQHNSASAESRCGSHDEARKYILG
jgi:PhnB protein